MFDIEKPCVICIKSKCKYLEEKELMTFNGNYHTFYNCQLSVKERFSKCPRFLEDLKKYDIPTDLMKRVDSLYERNNRIERTLKEKIDTLKNVLDEVEKEKRLKKECQIENAKLNSLLSEIKNRLIPEKALFKDGDNHRVFVNDINNVLDKW